MAKCSQCGESFEGLEPGSLCPDCDPNSQRILDDSLGESAEPRKPARPKCPITNALVATNILVYAAAWAVQNYWPNLGPPDIVWGATWGPLTLGGQWWRLCSATFVHLNGPHLLDNMLALWIFGRRLEPILGRWVFLAFYLICGIAGEIVSLTFHVEQFACGASGAVFGIIGGLLAAYCCGRFRLSGKSAWGLGFLIIYSAYNIYDGYRTPYVDNAAHIAGLIMGLLLGVALIVSSSGNVRLRRSIWASITAILAVAIIAVRHYDAYVIPLAPAIRALEKNQLDDALNGINAALRQKPNDSLANALAADIYLRKGDLPDAQVAVDRSLASDPSNRGAKLVQAKLYLQRGRFSQAMETAEESEDYSREARLIRCTAEEGQGSHADAGECYLANDQPDQAIRAFQQALDSDPGDYKAQFGLAKAYQAKGMTKEAEAAALKAAGMKADKKKK